MKKIFFTFAFVRVRKLEFPGLVNNLILIVKKYDTVAFYIDGMFDTLLKLQPALRSLEVLYNRKPEAETYAELLERREKLLRAILDQKKASTIANVSTMSDQMKLITPFVEKYLGNILADNAKTRTERINQMFDAMEEDNELIAALTVVGLMIFLTELKSLEQSLEKVESLRRSLLSTIPKMKTKEVKSVVSVALSNFLKSVEFAMIQHPTLDYMPMVNEINVLLKSYQTQLKVRTTRNKKASGKNKLPIAPVAN